MSENVEHLSENSVKLIIEVTASQFDDALDKAFEKVVKTIKADGFRPGKMPKAIFLQRYGIESLYQEALDIVFNDTYPKAVMEAKVIPTDEPKIDLDYSMLKKGSGFTYTATVDVWPEVQLGTYKGLEVKPLSTKVTKKDVDEEVKKVLSNKAENVIKDSPAQVGDTVVIDFEGFVDDVAFEGGKAENYPLELGSKAFIPGFEDQLIGTKSNDEVEVKVTFPKDYQKDLAGKDATFKVKVHEVKEKVIPELTDELVEELEIENVKTKDEYLEHVKAELKDRKAKEAENHLVNTLVNMVCEGSKAEFPESLIRHGVENEVKRLEMQAKEYYKIPVEVLLQYSGIPSMDAFKKDAEAYLRKTYLQELVFEKIIELENIEASEEEIANEYLELAKAQSGDDLDKKLADVKKQYKATDVAYQVRAKKVVALLKETAITKTTKN